MATELPPKQRRFADLVLSGRPASRAYREAGYKATTDATAEVCGSRLLSNPKLAAYIAERRAAAAGRAELDYAGFLRKFADFACDKDVDHQQPSGEDHGRGRLGGLSAGAEFRRRGC